MLCPHLSVAATQIRTRYANTVITHHATGGPSRFNR